MRSAAIHRKIEFVAEEYVTDDPYVIESLPVFFDALGGSIVRLLTLLFPPYSLLPGGIIPFSESILQAV